MTITVSGFSESVYFSGLPTTPSGLTVDPVTGTLFFADFGDTNGILRQLSTNKTVSTVTTDFTPGSGFYAYMATDIQFANGFVYTTLSNGDLVQVDTKTGSSTVLTNFAGFGAEAGLGINGSKLYVTDGMGSANQIWEYDLSTNTKTLKVSNLPPDAFGLEFDLARNKAYFAVNGSGFYVVDLAAGTYRLLASVPSGVGNFAIEPAGNFLYARVGDTIQRISVDNGSAIAFQTGLVYDDKGDLTFGRSSSGSGSSLYVANGNSIIEISGFASSSSSGSSASNLPPANFNGTDGNDVLPANGANNTGDDTFAPRLGRDYVDGGAGNDLLVVDYSANSYVGNGGPPAGIQSYLSQTGSNSFNGSFRAYKDNYGNYDEVNFSNIERFYVVGTNANDLIRGAIGNDTLIGNGGNDILEAGAGNDTINAGLGNDDVRAGDGNDTINAGLGNADRVDGGNGHDLLIVDYLTSVSASPGGSAPSIYNQTYINAPGSYSGFFDFYNFSTGQSQRVDFNNIERFQIEGSQLNDYLNGTAAEDLLNGNGGDDVIDTREGNDTINGGLGNDDIRAGEGNDTINAGLGNADRVDGGNGHDLLIVDYSATVSQFPMAPGLNLSSYVYPGSSGSYSGSFGVYNSSTGQSHRVDFNNMERFQIEGSQFNDSLMGGMVDETINGNGGNDVIDAREGNDTINGGLGDDDIRAGEGNDTINAGLGNADRADGGNGNDLLIVDYSATVGANTAPNAPGLGLSSYASTYDFVSYSGSYSVYSSSSSQYHQVNFNNIERFQIEGSQFNDYLTTTLANDVINANGGDDVIDAREGNDIINGGLGNDDIRAGEGNDTINAGLGSADRADGGNGNDLLIVDYSATVSTTGSQGLNMSSYLYMSGPSGYSGSLSVHNSSTGQSHRVDFNNMERFQIEGSQLNDSLMGTMADDIINGGTGSDMLVGGQGNDVLSLGSDLNSDTVQYNNGEGTDTVHQFVRGMGGDRLSFSWINYIDVRTVGTSTEFRVGDGIQNNAGFGTGALLVTLNGTTGFSASDIGVNLNSTGQFSFS